jgi:hypothetical protein
MQEVGIIAKLVDEYEGLSAAGRSLVDRLVIGPDRYLVTKHSGSKPAKKRMRRGATAAEQQPQPARKRGGRPRKLPAGTVTTKD